MKQFKNKKSNNLKVFFMFHLAYIVIGFNYYIISPEAKASWWIVLFVLIILLMYINSLMKSFRDVRQKVVLEFDDERIFFHDIDKSVSWNEVIDVKLVYKTFTTLIKVTTSFKIDNIKKENRFDKFIKIFKIPKVKHVITIRVEELEGYYKDIYEEIENAFKESKA